MNQRGNPTRYAALGLITILLVTAIGVVSYRANRGLPGQSHYRVVVEVPDATRIVANNPVRIGGVRVGQVDAVEAVPQRGGRAAYARLELRLKPSAGPLPADTTVQVGIGSPIGSTVVDLTPGDSATLIEGGGRLPLEQAEQTVQITDLLEVFDASTRRGIRDTLIETGPGLAGRGRELNAAIGDTARLLGPAQRVLRVLGDPATGLERFLRGYGATAAEFEPARDFSALMVAGAPTFEALQIPEGALSATIRAAQPAEASITRALKAIDPSLGKLTTIATALQPGVRSLPPALSGLSDVLGAARPALQLVPAAGRDLRGTLAKVERLARAPSTAGVLRQLGAMSPPLDRLFMQLRAAQVGCNIYGVFMENAFSVLGGTGTAENSFELVSIATLGATNELFQNAEMSPDLSVNGTPNSNEQECEAGNEPYSRSQPRRRNPEGLQYGSTRDTPQPPGAREKARAAGLYDSPGERR